jgi:predicted ATPase/DNA-binding CsgD family transcriptional regulator
MSSFLHDRPALLAEHLTHREREILARLAGDLYRREIAEALTLSPNSVKWYTHQIYAKLGVNSRKEAIRRARELGLLDFKTTALFQSHNLPAALTPFVGRQRELAQICQLLNDQVYRLLTLTGTGGVGKTRLALRAAHDLQGRYPQGAWLVELASLSDPGLIPQTVAAAFDLRPEGDRSGLKALMDYLQNRNLLLVLDNCEHLLVACADLANNLLKYCPGLHILATSREILRIAAERTFVVPPLSFPGPGEKHSPQELIQFEAVDLFTRRAKEALPDFELNEENAETVVQICRQLDGIPLALELAAARLRAMDLEQIIGQLKDRFHLLTGGDRSAQPQLQTMRTSIDWSYQLLPEGEQTLLMRLSVFTGGCTAEAAKAVCADDSLPEADILDLLTQLVDKSMLLVIRRRGQELRYRLLETVRQYASEKLSSAGQAGLINDRHLDYFLGLAGCAEPELVGADQRLWFDRLELEHDNLRLAMGWALKGAAAGPEAGLRMASRLWWFWFVRGYMMEGGKWLERTLAASTSQSPADQVTRAIALAKLPWMEYFQTHSFEEALALGRMLGPAGRESVALALWGMGNQACMQVDYALSQSLERQSLELFRELGHRWGTCEALTTLGMALGRNGNYQQAATVLEESLELAREAGDTNEIAFAHQVLGLVAMARGEYDQAAFHFEQSSALYQEIDLHGRGWESLGDVARLKGDLALAASWYRKTLALYWEWGSARALAIGLEDLARVAALDRQQVRSARLYGAAQALRESSGESMYTFDRLEYEQFLESIRPQLDDAAWKACWSEGRAMPLKDTVAYALSDQDTG